MSAGRKFIYVAVLTGLAAVLMLSIFSACDNRKAVNPQLSINQTITMDLSPANLVVHSSTNPDTVEILMRVRSTDGSGIDSIDVLLNRYPEVGTIVSPPKTSEGGYTSALYITDPGAEDSVITFIARSGNAADTSVLNITVKLATISMSLLPPQMVIHSLNKSDSIQIDIRVRDGDGNGIDSVDVEMIRSPAIGTIVPPLATSQGGWTSAIYVTDPGITQNTQIIISARAESAVDVDTLDLLISLQGEIDNIFISLEKTSLIADGNDSTHVYLSVIDTTGAPISDNTPIFLDNYGAGTPGTLNKSYALTENGIATFVLTAPPTIDTSMIVAHDSLAAWGISVSGDTVHAYSSIAYQPAGPAMLYIATNPQDMVAGSGEAQEILVRVTDEQGNFVRDGTQVRFRNDLSTSDITTLTTTLGGYATGVYTVGTESGLDILQAYYIAPGSTDTLFSGQVTLTVRSSEPTNIALRAANPTIEVGGIATMVYATMQDENGNPLSDGYQIRFEITAAPALTGPLGPSFQYVSGPDSINLTTIRITDVNGRASVSLFSGTRSGTVRIKATSVLNESVFKEKPLVTIQSGPPARIDIGPSNVAANDGEAIITGVTALVWDAFTNPVEPLTAVHFEVMPDTIAYIEGAAYTGPYPNPDDTTQMIGELGMASTWMAYTCYHTFDTVRVVASSGDMADTSEAIILAIYDGQLSVFANPSVVYCAPNQTQQSDISALLQDGLFCPIKNGIIIFSVSGCGRIAGQSIDTTGVDGWAYATFSISYDQIPYSDPNLPPFCIAKVKATLLGYPEVVGETDIHCYTM